MDAAEPECAFPVADDETLDPAAGSGTLDVEVEPVSVGVPPDGGGSDEGGGECVVRMSVLRLGLPGYCGAGCHTIHPPIIIEMAPDFNVTR